MTEAVSCKLCRIGHIVYSKMMGLYFCTTASCSMNSDYIRSRMATGEERSQ